MLHYCGNSIMTNSPDYRKLWEMLTKRTTHEFGGFVFLSHTKHSNLILVLFFSSIAFIIANFC